MKKSSTHKFCYDESGRKLVCPACGSLIAPPDVEMFSACPYCNAAIANDAELEDFTIDPLVRHWQNRCLNSGIVGGR